VAPACDVIFHDLRAEQLRRLWRNWACWHNPQVRHSSKTNDPLVDLVDSAYNAAQATTRPKAKQLVNAGPTEVRIDEQHAAATLRQDQRRVRADRSFSLLRQGTRDEYHFGRCTKRGEQNRSAKRSICLR